jgi:hypothetical protein
MWGYGARHDALSTGALDPLYATALVIQAGSNKLAMVGLDLGRSPTEAHLRKIRERISELGFSTTFLRELESVRRAQQYLAWTFPISWIGRRIKRLRIHKKPSDPARPEARRRKPPGETPSAATAC